MKPKRDKELRRTCRFCKKEVIFWVNSEDYRRWKLGVLVQHAFPYLAADLRELLVSNICGECFDKMFPEED